MARSARLADVREINEGNYVKHQSSIPSGFTLLEVLVVLAIIGILLSFAVPAYTEHVTKGRRADATATLMQAQQYMERFYLENRTYTNPDFSSRFSKVPATGTPNYKVTLDAPGGTTYVLTMTRENPGPMANDRCGNFTLDNFGRRAVINFNTSRWSGAASATQARQYCWAGG